MYYVTPWSLLRKWQSTAAQNASADGYLQLSALLLILQGQRMREGKKGGGGSIHTIQWGEFTRRGPFKLGETHAYT